MTKKTESFDEYEITPYSMNSLFSEFFKKFGGVLLEVFETILSYILGGYFGGVQKVAEGKTIIM